MILLIEIGNTNIHLGKVINNSLVEVYYIASKPKLSIHEYLVTMEKMIPLKEIKKIVLSSVVPSLLDEFTKLKDILKCSMLIVNNNIKTGVNLLVDNPKEVGADLILDVAGLCGLQDTIIIDLGTANKYIYTDGKNMYGCLFSPGLLISMNALSASAALLPEISVSVPRKVIGKNTVDCMKSGVIYGLASEIDGTITRMEKEIGHPCKHVLTGGYATTIYPLLDKEVEVIENLCLIGMLNVYKMNIQ